VNAVDDLGEAILALDADRVGERPVRGRVDADGHSRIVGLLAPRPDGLFRRRIGTHSVRAPKYGIGPRLVAADPGDHICRRNAPAGGRDTAVAVGISLAEDLPLFGE